MSVVGPGYRMFLAANLPPLGTAYQIRSSKTGHLHNKRSLMPLLKTPVRARTRVRLLFSAPTGTQARRSERAGVPPNVRLIAVLPFNGHPETPFQVFVSMIYHACRILERSPTHDAAHNSLITIQPVSLDIIKV